VLSKLVTPGVLHHASDTWAHAAGPSSLGTGDSSCHCSGAGMSGSVPAIAVGHSAAAASHSVAASWSHVAYSFGYRNCSFLAHVADRSDYYYYPKDSSYTVQWASESWIAGCTVCLTYWAGVLVVRFTTDRAGSTLHSYSYELYSYSVWVSASDRHSSL